MRTDDTKPGSLGWTYENPKTLSAWGSLILQLGSTVLTLEFLYCTNKNPQPHQRKGEEPLRRRIEAGGPLSYVRVTATFENFSTRITDTVVRTQLDPLVASLAYLPDRFALHMVIPGDVLVRVDVISPKVIVNVSSTWHKVSQSLH
jgi:hypothetical protein